MKWRNVFLFAPLLLVVAGVVMDAAPAAAESPQPYVYALVKCSGLPVDTLVKAQQAFDTRYGYAHQLTTPAQWRDTYDARTNEFAALLGCNPPLDGGQLTFWYRLYVPVYQSILQATQ